MMGYRVWSRVIGYGSFLSLWISSLGPLFLRTWTLNEFFPLHKLINYHYLVIDHSPYSHNHTPMSNMFQCFMFQCLFANLSLLCDNYWRTHNYLHLTNDLLIPTTRQTKSRQTATDFTNNRPTDIWLTKDGSKRTNHVSYSLRSQLHHGLTERRPITSRGHRPIRTTTRDL